MYQAIETDMKRAFISDATLHIINESSVRDLSKRVLAKYDVEEERKKIKVEAEIFRPNVIIDTGNNPY